MGVLKKGSKGNPVRELQELLNKNGAKPALKVDGDFGPKTLKAVREFQKRVKLKIDGKAGDFTMAAARYGGPLPEMAVKDYKKWLSESRGKWMLNNSTLEHMDQIRLEVKKLSAVMEKHMPIAEKFFTENIKYRNDVDKIGGKISERQKKFEAVLLKSPAEAKKLADECAVLDKKVETLLANVIKPNLKKASNASTASADQIRASMDVINERISDLKKLARGVYV